MQIENIDEPVENITRTLSHSGMMICHYCNNDLKNTKSKVMKIVKVTYTVKAGFATENQKNVQVFMEDLRRANDPGLQYISYLGADGKTFTHIATCTSDTAQQTLLELPSFQAFQQKRDDSGLEKELHIEEVSLVAATYDLH